MKTKSKSLIYTITTIYLDNDKDGIDKIDWKKYRDRCVGFYFSCETALKCVDEDWADFDEGCYYNYLVIEKLIEGLYPSISPDSDEQMWFKYERENDKWVRCEKPHSLRHIVGFSIG